MWKRKPALRYPNRLYCHSSTLKNLLPIYKNRLTWPVLVCLYQKIIAMPSEEKTPTAKEVIESFLYRLNIFSVFLYEKNYEDQILALTDELDSYLNDLESFTPKVSSTFLKRVTFFEKKALKRMFYVGSFSILVLISLLVYGVVSTYFFIKSEYKAGIYKEFIRYFDSFLSTGLGKTIGVTFVSLTGSLLFIFKKKQQLHYGIVETAVAISSCIVLVQNLELSLSSEVSNFSFLSGMTTIYLIVRGLSNITEGLNKPYFMQGYFRTLDNSYKGSKLGLANEIARSYIRAGIIEENKAKRDTSKQ